jgi:hypothetical protein
MTEHERAEMYREFLAEEGYVLRLDDDGDVVFKCEGMTFIIVLEADEQYFRIVCPYFWSIDSEEELDHVAHAACEVTSRIKVAKVYPVEGDTWAAVEMYCSPPEAVLPVLLRAIRTLRHVITAFQIAMRKRS